MNITIATNKNVAALDIGYDSNGNRRHVLHWLPIYNAIAERTGMAHDALDNAPYMHAQNAMRAIGGKKYHNKSYGGGIAFTIDRSQLEHDVNTAIDTYARWYNSENITHEEVSDAADAILHRLSIVVKSTNAGYRVTGHYSLGMELTTKCDYTQAHGLTANPLRAALLWAKKAQYKRWQLNGTESRIVVADTYTCLDANTRVYMFTIEGA